jgi:transcriptional regulator with XRE-family HTH domain
MEICVTFWQGRHRRLRRFARDDILFRVAYHLVRRRRQLRWTQTKLARRLGVPVSVIRALEIAELSFTLAAFETMSDVLGPSASDLLAPIPVRLRRVATRALLRRSWNGGYSPGWRYSPCAPPTILLSEPRPVKAGWRHGPPIPGEPWKRTARGAASRSLNRSLKRSCADGLVGVALEHASTMTRSNSGAAGASSAIRLAAIKGPLQCDSAIHFTYWRRPISLDELSQVTGTRVRVKSLILPFQRDRRRVVLTAMSTASSK